MISRVDGKGCVGLLTNLLRAVKSVTRRMRLPSALGTKNAGLHHVVGSRFDPNVKTVVLTDASRLYGIGFALVQVYKDKLALIQCGSASLSPTQSRYSTVELECLTIVHAIQKCHYYLVGITRFEVWKDHRPQTPGRGI